MKTLNLQNDYGMLSLCPTLRFINQCSINVCDCVCVCGVCTGENMAYRKAHAIHGSSMHPPQDLEREDLDLEWEMEMELEEPELDNFQLEFADSQTLGNSFSGEMNSEQLIQPSVSPHGRFKRLQEDSNYVLQFSGTVPRGHKMRVTCIVKFLLFGAGAFFLGLLIGLHAKRPEKQPTTPTTSTDILERVIQNITAEKIQTIKRSDFLIFIFFIYLLLCLLSNVLL